MGELNDGALHPLARLAIGQIGRPTAEVERAIAEAAAGDVDAVEAARRDLCRRLGSRPDDVAASFALRFVHALRDRLQATSTTAEAA